jgi:predicted anti-sigma-YlaC factor YlaD
MRCSEVQLALSARMDGDPRPLAPAAAEHAESCPRCRAFADGAARVRRAVRFEVAEPVPDLVGAVMTRVRAEAPAGPVPLVRVRTVPSRRVARLVAAAVAGLMVGSAITAAGLLPGRTPAAEAGDIPREIAAAAPGVTAYSASFAIVERNWRPEVPERAFEAEVEFRGPEAFRVRLADLTAYPPGLDARNDFTLRVQADRWALHGPQACTPQAAPACVPAPPMDRSVSGRPPFDADAPMPTDVVLPVLSLAGSERVPVTGGGAILGRTAVRVEVAAEQAAPLFASFQAAGSWRPLYPADPVDLWLDRGAWIPLRFEVRSAGGPDRDAWASANGIPAEAAGEVVLTGEVTRLSLDEPAEPPRFFPGPDPGARDRGFVDLSEPELTAALGYRPLAPAETAGLEEYRTGRFAGRPEAVLAYARGLSWLRITQTRSHRAAAPFGGVGILAERVALAGGGVALYEPAGEHHGRRVAIHAQSWDAVLESNLPRADLLRVAGSLPVRGLDAPPSWLVRDLPGGRIERVEPAEAIDRAGFPVLAPRGLPAGLRFAAAELTAGPTTRAITSFYRRGGIELAGFALRIHQARGEPLPPASGTDQVSVAVRGVTGRWSPVRHELEWIEAGAYRSLRAPWMDLSQVVGIASGMEPA